LHGGGRRERGNVADERIAREPGAAELAAGPADFGELLRQYRAARGLSQAALAARAGLDRSYVNRMEAGERGAPAQAAAEALAQALDLADVEADRLFVAAGLLPRSLRALGVADPTLLLLAQRLTDQRLSIAARAALRATVETIARCWSNPAPPSMPGSFPPAPPAPPAPTTQPVAPTRSPTPPPTRTIR
jgi:transcriptional regulator with XRE-family HTH domain